MTACRCAVSALVVTLLGVVSVTGAQSPRETTGTPAVIDRLDIPSPGPPSKIDFAVRRLDAGTVETAVAMDANGDRRLDIVAGDSTVDLVTAKRYLGRNASAPGASEPLGVYGYESRRDGAEMVWTRHTIAFDQGVGGGLQMTVEDLDGDGDLDIIAPGKTGLFVIENRTR